MAREKRIWFPGASYHIMSRGNYRQNIFHEKEDYQTFLQLLQDTSRRYAFELHGYCCMTNHFHLLIATEIVEIWMIMKRLNHLYAAYHNQKYKLSGHLFQGRYKSCLVQSDAYFLQTSRYIHLNPVKAGIVEHPENYPWSSYGRMIGQDGLALVNTEKTLSYFEEPRELKYQQFVESSSPYKIEKELEIQKELGE